MTDLEFVKLVEYILDRWGSQDEIWANADRFAADFAELDDADVWAGLFAYCSDPKRAAWAPKPKVLTAMANEQARRHHDPARRPQLPESTSRGFWKEWATETYGEAMPVAEAIRRRHIETEGMAVEETEARLPSDYGWIEDGGRPKVQCLSELCDIHNESPMVMGPDVADVAVEGGVL